jgi:hypothetical protein
VTTHEFWDQIFCPQNGWVSHVVIHEAAHAVFALKSGFPIREVRIGPPASLMPLLTVATASVTDGDRFPIGNHRSALQLPLEPASQARSGRQEVGESDASVEVASNTVGYR